jgi:hypothetical protein
MKISMYLDPSKYWWAYLGIRSNPLLFPQGSEPFDRAIFLDHPSGLAAAGPASAQLRTRYYFILWDGLRDPREIDEVRAVLGASADLTILVVGDLSQASKDHRIQSLYPPGTMTFDAAVPQFDRRTAAILLAARLKALLMPAKNILQARRAALPMIELLFGKRRTVFCGAYGSSPIMLEILAARHSVDRRLLDGYEYYSNDPNPSFETYRKYLRGNGLFLARLHDECIVEDAFFLSAFHFLGREYILERVRATGIDLFLNGFDSGINVNVYTTPFYRQHVFLDFGSAVGAGNYPRLADLRYFRKQVVQIDLSGELEQLLALARNGELEKHFERKWELKAPKLLKSMAG